MAQTPLHNAVEQCLTAAKLRQGLMGEFFLQHAKYINLQGQENEWSSSCILTGNWVWNWALPSPANTNSIHYFQDTKKIQHTSGITQITPQFGGNSDFWSTFTTIYTCSALHNLFKSASCSLHKPICHKILFITFSKTIISKFNNPEKFRSLVKNHR